MKGGDRLVDLEEKGRGWAIAATLGFVTGALAAMLMRKKGNRKGTRHA